jgi:O-antigen/teichoic acid export membrane protein
MWRRISRNALSNAAGTAVSLALGLLLTPLVFHHLGARDFGMWALAASITGYAGLLDFGMAPTLVKKAAEHLACPGPESRRALSRTVSTVWTLYLGLALLMCAATAVLVLFAVPAFRIPPAQAGSFRLVVSLIGLQAAAGLPMSVWNGLLAGLEQFHLLNALSIGVGLLRAALTIALLAAGCGVAALVLVGLGCASLSWALTWRMALRRLPALEVSCRHFDRGGTGDLAQFSGTMILWSLAGYAVHQGDRLLVGLFLPLSAVATYEIGARLSNHSRSFLHSWLWVILPASSALRARRDRDSLRELYLRGTRCLLLSYLGMVVPLIAFGRDFLELWGGRPFREAYPVMAVLLLASAWQSQNVVGHVMLAGTGQLRAFRWAMAAYPALILALSPAAILRFGMAGAAIAVATAVVLVESAFLFSIARTFETAWPELLGECHWPALVSAAPAVAWAVLALAALPPRTWPALVVDVGACLAIYAISAWARGTTAEERESVKRALRGRGRVSLAPADVP